jgi:hypothetical protein
MPPDALVVIQDSASKSWNYQRARNLSSSVGSPISISRDVASGKLDPFVSFPPSPVPNAQELLHHCVCFLDATWRNDPEDM